MEIKNVCCCCLLQPPDKHLKTPYSRLGKTEIYANMLKECFEIQLIPLLSDECGICEVCVGRLRDASDFKLQVQRSQAELRALLQRTVCFKEEKKTEVPDDDAIRPDCEEGLIVSNVEGIKTEISFDPLPSNEDKEFKKFILDGGNQYSEVRVYKEEVFTDPKNEKYGQSDEPDTKPKGSNKDTQCASTTYDHHSDLRIRNTYTCDICGKLFPTRAGFGRHMSRIHKKTEHYCTLCKKQFKCKSLFDKHIHIHTGEKLYGCDICNKQYSFKSSLLMHKRVHTEQVFICDVCQMQFKLKSALVYHMGSHTGQTVSCCKFCDIKFLDHTSLRKHIRMAHEIPGQYVCDECKRVFNYRVQLIAHLNNHNQSRIYACNDCGLTLATEGSLRRHRLIHTGEKPHCCELCNKRFRYKVALMEHKTIHTGVKTHCCEVCGKQFARKDYLKRHLNIHVDGAVFPCELCNKSYSTKESLRQHKRSHMKEKGANNYGKKIQKKKRY